MKNHSFQIDEVLKQKLEKAINSRVKDMAIQMFPGATDLPTFRYVELDDKTLNGGKSLTDMMTRCTIEYSTAAIEASKNPITASCKHKYSFGRCTNCGEKALL